MTVRAEQRQILRPIVFPIAVDMLDLYGHASRLWMALVPAATRALFAKLPYEVFSDEPIAIVGMVRSLLQRDNANLKLIAVLTCQRAEFLLS